MEKSVSIFGCQPNFFKLSWLECILEFREKFTISGVTFMVILQLTNDSKPSRRGLYMEVDNLQSVDLTRTLPLRLLE